MSEQAVALPHNPDYPVLTPTQAQAALAFIRDGIDAESKLAAGRAGRLLDEAYAYALNYFE